jgi:hypothetical protein
MSIVHLFYGTQLVASLNGRNLTSKDIKAQFGQEIYDGAYIYSPFMTKTWWRCNDLTPVIVDDVPKELRALALLLT